MKKIYLFLLAGIALTSCSKSDSSYTQSSSYTTTNLVTSIETGESFAQSAYYNFFFNVGEGISQASVSNLSINNSSYSFTTFDTNYTTYYVTGGSGFMTLIKSPEATVTAGSHSYPLESSDITISTLNYWNISLPGASGPVYSTPAVLWQYNIGNLYNVKTFAADAVYQGNTETSYPNASGGTDTFKSETMTYRFRIDLEENKADMIIYKARFAESMPIELASIVVEGLDVEWKEGTYAITGTDLIPVIYEGTTPTPYPNYVFNSVYFEPTNSTLTQGKLTYKVAGRFNGSFEGSYIFEPQLNN